MKTIITTLLIGFALSLPAQADEFQGLREAGINFISAGDRLIIYRTKDTAPSVDALDLSNSKYEVEIIDRAESLEEAAAERKIEERRRQRQE